MKSASASKTALIIIDVQNGFLHPTHWGKSRSTPECEANIARLLGSARELNAKLAGDPARIDDSVLICHVHHHSIYPDSELHPKKSIEVDGRRLTSVHAQDFVTPKAGESVWTKNVNSAFVGNGLEAFLREKQVKQLIICGLTTDHCVSTSTRMANNLRIVDVVSPTNEVVEEGNIVLVGNACATYSKGGFDAETVHGVNLASLDEFAEIQETADVLSLVFNGTE
jgi:nicotinamidase-related amidase